VNNRQQLTSRELLSSAVNSCSCSSARLRDWSYASC